MKESKEKLKSFDKAILEFCSKYGFESSSVFDDFLRYVINGFTIPGFPGLTDWKYTEEQNKGFFELYQNFILNLQEKLKHSDWYDILGETYEAIIAGKGRRSNSGQFFTPMTLCDLMTEITEFNSTKRRPFINDPTCGSGRTLLSFNSKHMGCYYVAEDVDKTCCMMTVVNFLTHGIQGEVVHHDSLTMEDSWNAWQVNSGLNDWGSKFHGVINIRPLEYKDTFLARKLTMTEIKKRMDSVELKTLKSGDMFIYNHRAWQVSYQNEDNVMVVLDAKTRAAWHLSGRTKVKTCYALSYKRFEEKMLNTKR